MPGSSNITGDESILFCDNMSFDGTERGGKMITNGQLFIGATASNRANNGGHVRLGQLTSPDTTVVIGYSDPNITLSSPGSKFTQFTTSGTWTKDPRAKWVSVIGFAGGAGGGSGRRGASLSNRGGGGGGACNGFFSVEGPAQFFGATETVTIGAGGTGGTAILANDTNGNPGGNSNDSRFGNASSCNSSAGAAAGAGGTTSGGGGGATLNGTVQTPFFVWTSAGSVEGTSGSTTTPSTPSNYPTSNGAQSGVVLYPGGGGGGGGINSADTVGNGSNARSQVSRQTGSDVVINAGGLAGTSGASGGNGNPSLVTGGVPTAGTGGGGGGASAAAPAGAGGNGGIPGGGGGGGGASLNGNNSGAGGNGARGEIWVIELL